jgi:hypothetical protein
MARRAGAAPAGPLNARQRPALRGAALAGALLAAAACHPAQAGLASTGFCDAPARLTAAQLDRKLRLADVLLRELQRSGSPAVLVSRNGLNLKRLGVDLSHAGIGLRDSPNGAYSVRQLYYACDEGRPRLYDQGLAGFAAGSDEADAALLSLVLLPPEAAQALAQAALDERRAQALLAPRYSANAYAYSTRYQNCNQWVAELLALAWHGPGAGEPSRSQAQAWLRAMDYRPQALQMDSHWWMAAAGFVPLVHLDDHPEDDRYALRQQISLPASLEAFARQRWPEAQRVQLCQNRQHIVLRRGGPPLHAECRPEPGDEVTALD